MIDAGMLLEEEAAPPSRRPDLRDLYEGRTPEPGGQPQRPDASDRSDASCAEQKQKDVEEYIVLTRNAPKWAFAEVL